MAALNKVAVWGAGDFPLAKMKTKQKIRGGDV